MYSNRTGLILAFHGCDQMLVQDVLNGRSSLKASKNKYDWLGHCLDLLHFENLKSLKHCFGLLEANYKDSAMDLPVNKNVGTSNDLLLRELDCVVIEMSHQFRKDLDMPEVDSVRGVFWEGTPLYPNAGFREKDHIQICIRNPNCIKGYFLPKKEDAWYKKI